MEHFNCSRHLIKPYLIILENSNLIKISKVPNLINEKSISDSTQVFLKDDTHQLIFNKIKRIFGTYKNFSEHTKIHKANISIWKQKKVRIKLATLKKFCEKCDINFSVVLNNIEQTDRKIIEII